MQYTYISMCISSRRMPSCVQGQLTDLQLFLILEEIQQVFAPDLRMADVIDVQHPSWPRWGEGDKEG